MSNYILKGVNIKTEEVVINIIKKNRLNSKLTQKQLAKYLKVHQVYISELETNKRIPSSNIIFDLSEFLNICPILIFRDYYCKDTVAANKKCKQCKKIHHKTITTAIIKRNRLNSNLTQKQLAKRCKIDQSYISGLENYKKMPSSNIIWKIGEVLDVCPLLILKDYYCKQHSNIYSNKQCRYCKYNP